jgi:hypothetical protein
VELPRLAFPEYNFKIESPSLSPQSAKIFDIVRKKYVALTPEEWVRQHLLHFLVMERNFRASLLSVEKKLLVDKMEKRTDVVAYSKSLKPLMIAECKAPAVKLTQDVFDQAARYNRTFGVSFLLITNGHESFFCQVDNAKGTYLFREEIPRYEDLVLLSG